MQKNKFEKQVQQKMEELELHPSDAVWQNIESRMSNTRRRKRGWVFFSLLLVCLCGGGYFLWHQRIGAVPDYEVKGPKSSLTKQNAAHPLKKLSQKPVVGKAQHEENTVKSPTVQKHTMLSSQSIKRNTLVKNIAKTQNIKIITAALSSAKSGIEPGYVQKDLHAYTRNTEVENVLNTNTDKKYMPGIIPDPKEKNIKVPEHLNQSPAVINKINDSLNEHQKDIVIANTQQSKAKHEKLKNAWKWGITFSAGVSGIPNTLFGSLDKSYSSADALNSSYPPQPTRVLPSKIESSAALITGFFAEKNISKKKMITMGLRYKLFSLTSKVGKRIESSASASRFSVSNPINKYHNYFHFIELPVSLKVRLSSGKLPLFWEGGISVSQLISSNALQVDNTSTLYTRKNTLFNKSQVGFNTGLSASFFPKQKASVLIGPDLFYGITRIAKEGLYKNQHFTFIGLRAQVLFKK